jgi:hypothetical protein
MPEEYTRPSWPPSRAETTDPAWVSVGFISRVYRWVPPFPASEKAAGKRNVLV